MRSRHSITNHRIRLKFSELDENNATRIEKNLKKRNDIQFKWVDESDLREEFPSSISGKLIKLRNKNKKQPELPVGNL